MYKASKYQLFIGNNCCSCEKVVDYLKNNHINITTTNIDIEDYDLPFSLMIIPALIKDDKLIAYGDDIKRYFESKSQSN